MPVMINPDVFLTDIIGKYTQNRYLISIIIFLFFLFLSRLLAVIFHKVFMRIAKKTKTLIDDKIVENTEKPLTYLIFIMGIKIALVPLAGLHTNIIHFLKVVTDSFIVGIITYIVIVIFDIVIDAWGKKWAARTKSTIDDEVIPLLHKFSKIILIIFGALLILSSWGVEVGPFIASLGIAGIAIGFAVQDSLKNIFGGISLILDKNFKVDDTVKLSSGETGKVLDVGLRSTRILTWDHEVMIIPNGELANSTIINYAQPELMSRIQLDFGVEYGSDVDKVRKVALDVIKSIENVLKDPEPFIRFKKLNDFSLDFTIYFWVSSYTERFSTKDIAMQGVYEALNDNGIGIPFPTRTVYMYDQGMKKGVKTSKKHKTHTSIKLTEEQAEEDD